MILFVVIAMRTKKSKNSKLGILFLLPVFLLYVNHSLLIYHSHIFSNGTNDCESKSLPTNQNDHPSKRQIIVFQGLMLVLNSNPLPVFIVEYKSDFFIKICLPLIQTECSGFTEYKPGRAPPIFFS